MRLRAIIACIVCAHVLTGCETNQSSADAMNRQTVQRGAGSGGKASADPETTGSIASASKQSPQSIAAASDDAELAKSYFQSRKFSLAEKHFRRASETRPDDGKAWVGLAACYDQLRQFDRADRAYSRAFALLGEQPSLLNNQGYSFILRGDYHNAREKLRRARAAAPDNPYVKANIALLEERSRTSARR